ncbi:hypothetical protein LXL04_020327 [Taraxacum kok-saghyz]
MRGSQLYTALFFPSLEVFHTGFSLASIKHYIEHMLCLLSFNGRLEWLSDFMKDIFSDGGLTTPVVAPANHKTTSPVPILNSVQIHEAADAESAPNTILINQDLKLKNLIHGSIRHFIEHMAYAVYRMKMKFNNEPEIDWRSRNPRHIHEVVKDLNPNLYMDQLDFHLYTTNMGISGDKCRR